MKEAFFVVAAIICICGGWVLVGWLVRRDFRNRKLTFFGAIAQMTVATSIITAVLVPNMIFIWSLVPPVIPYFVLPVVRVAPDLLELPLAVSTVVALVTLLLSLLVERFKLFAPTLATLAFSIALLTAVQLQASSIIRRHADAAGMDCVTVQSELAHLRSVGFTLFGDSHSRAHAWAVKDGESYAWSWRKMGFYLYQENERFADC